ncbi:MAG: tetratricopeptide repeat protein [Candidatus Sericytochromatia bacterium]|nr:tetratricopeptide repeat protein [Candidatus Sericytochromatia bacterium]
MAQIPKPLPVSPRRLDYEALVAKGYSGTVFDAHLETGEYREGVGDLRAALGFYLAAVELQPDHPAALRRAGEMYFRLGYFEDCLRLLTAAAAAGDTSAVVAYRLGRAAESLDRLSEALAHFDRSVAGSDRDAKTYYQRGRVHSRLGDLAAATDDLLKATQLVPQYLAAFYDLARIYALRQMADESLQTLRQIQGSRRMIQKVRRDRDFDFLRHYPSFWALLSGKITI